MDLWDRILGRRDPARRERLERAADAVVRELAGNLELAAVFDQTHQAALFENAEFTRHRATLEAEVPAACAELVDVYARMSETEDAMARRGPAASLRPEDRVLIEGWEGDVRSTQAHLAAESRADPPSALGGLLVRLRRGRATGR